MVANERNRLKIDIQKAIRDPDQYSIHFIYIADNKVSIRAVSPYRWEGKDRFVGLCLSRQNHRSFKIDQIHKLKVVKSSELTMPFPITECRVPKSRNRVASQVNSLSPSSNRAPSSTRAPGCIAAPSHTKSGGDANHARNL